MRNWVRITFLLFADVLLIGGCVALALDRKSLAHLFGFICLFTHLYVAIASGRFYHYGFHRELSRDETPIRYWSFVALALLGLGAISFYWIREEFFA
jgi:hypothetical protein